MVLFRMTVFFAKAYFFYIKQFLNLVNVCGEIFLLKQGFPINNKCWVIAFTVLILRRILSASINPSGSNVPIEGAYRLIPRQCGKLTNCSIIEIAVSATFMLKKYKKETGI